MSHSIVMTIRDSPPNQDDFLFLFWVVADPVPHLHLAPCFLTPLSILLVLVQVLREANARKGISLQREIPVGEQMGGCSKGWRAMSDHEAGLTPREGKRKEGRLDGSIPDCHEV